MPNIITINGVEYNEDSDLIFKCDECGDWYLIEDGQHLTHDGDYVCQECMENEYTRCEDCNKLRPNEDCTHISHKDKYVCEDCKSEHYFLCSHCEERHHNDYGYDTQRGETICESCKDEDFFYCEDCGGLFHNDDAYSDEDSDEYYCENCRDNRGEGSSYESEQSVDKDGYITSVTPTDTSSNYLKLLPTGDMPERIRSYLSNFYYLGEEKTEKLPYSIMEFTPITGELDIDSSDKIISRVKDSFSLSNYYYRKYKRWTFEGVNKLLLRFSYIDVSGKKRVREESFMKYHESFQAEYPNVLCKLDHNTLSSSGFKVVMSNDANHKLALCKANNSFNSCQVQENRTGYAKGLRDFICDGCKIPIAIYKGEELVGRMLVRYMEDRHLHKYLVLDRIYTTGSFGSYKKRMYREIYNWLLETMGDKYIIAVPTMSQHDDSIKSYINMTGKSIEYIDSQESIRSLKRQRGWINSAYYHDSKTRTYGDSAKSFMYDYLNKNSFVINKAQQELLNSNQSQPDETPKEISNESTTPTTDGGPGVGGPTEPTFVPTVEGISRRARYSAIRPDRFEGLGQGIASQVVLDEMDTFIAARCDRESLLNQSRNPADMRPHGLTSDGTSTHAQEDTSIGGGQSAG